MLKTNFHAVLIRYFFETLRYLEPYVYLLARFWVAKIFLLSGLTKISNWQTTLMLFSNQYQVPLLSPTAAAYLGTGLEFLLPILLILGLGGRIFIFIFFIYNIICVISFHFLWTPAGQSGLDDHINWGLLLALILVHGPGKISLDHLIHKKWGHHFFRKVIE